MSEDALTPSSNVEDLVMRAKVGSICGPELEEVARTLQRGAGNDTYQLLYVLGRTASRTHERLIASFLEFEQDAQVAALALRILCIQWGLGQKYREHLEKFLQGESWDILDEAKQSAISCAGEYLRGVSDCAILKGLLLSANPVTDNLIARFAVEALARSLGESHSNAVLPAGADARSWRDKVRSRAQQRLVTECAPS